VIFVSFVHVCCYETAAAGHVPEGYGRFWQDSFEGMNGYKQPLGCSKKVSAGYHVGSGGFRCMGLILSIAVFETVLEFVDLFPHQFGAQLQAFVLETCSLKQRFSAVMQFIPWA